MTIKITPLGAGQDVGRSCLLVSINGKNIMFDCGMHMGYNDARRFPDFGFIKKTGPYTSMIDCVIIRYRYIYIDINVSYNILKERERKEK